MKTSWRWTKAVALAIALLACLAMASANRSQAAWYDSYSFFEAKGTLAYWPMDGNALDKSGHSLTGIVTDATLEAGRFGQCFKFNGTSARIRVLDIQHPAGLSIAAWIKLDAYPAAGNLATIYNRRATYNDLIFGVNSTGKLAVSVLRGVTGLPSVSQSEQSITTGTWHHVAALVDGVTIRLYLDGVLVRAGVSAGALNWTGGFISAYLGACGSADAASQFFKGSLDEVAIFNRVLTSAEVLGLAADTNGNGQANFWEDVPRITIAAPLVGVTLPAGSAYDIVWESKGAGASVKIERTLNGGTTWVLVAAAAANIDGRNVYHWTVPSEASTTAYVRITSNAKAAVKDQKGPFTIAVPVVRSIKIVQPAAGATLTHGAAYDILWDSVEAGAYVKIERSLNGGSTWVLVATEVANVGGRNTYHWTAPNDLSTNALVRVSSYAYPDVRGVSGVFTIN